MMWDAMPWPTSTDSENTQRAIYFPTCMMSKHYLYEEIIAREIRLYSLSNTYANTYQNRLTHVEFRAYRVPCSTVSFLGQNAVSRLSPNGYCFHVYMYV